MKNERKYRQPKSKIDPDDKPIAYQKSDGEESEDYDWSNKKKFWPENGPTFGVKYNFVCDKKHHKLQQVYKLGDFKCASCNISYKGREKHLKCEQCREQYCFNCKGYTDKDIPEEPEVEEKKKVPTETDIKVKIPDGRYKAKWLSSGKVSDEF